MSENLKPEKMRALLRYDPETGKLSWLPRPREMFKTKRSFSTWNARYANQEAFTFTTVGGYRRGAINYRLYLAHRVAWVIVHGYWPPQQIDHINGVRDDNRIENLREVSQTVNSRNAKMRSTNTSGVNGVSWHKRTGKWQSYINLDGKLRYLGLFDDIDDAISARRVAEVGKGYTGRHGKIVARACPNALPAARD